MTRPESPALSPERVEALAGALGAMPESYNVFDYTDEATTLIKADVDHLAQSLAPLIGAWLAEEREGAVHLAADELDRILSGFAANGRHTRARWAVDYLRDQIAARIARSTR